ncbi:hypothetical protein BX666DRAFT_2026717 [Dichotomocladium elegans]|nr:hypothetical protein BX666DRAFT_2026717 [Dichotomocladium elegans]
MLERSGGYVQAGSFFPDWGYQCMGYNQQAEDAHWAPFIRASVEYIKETYPNPRSTDNPHVEGLVSFLFAVMSHDVADVRWHSLRGLENYFIDAMAQMNFHGSFSKAHRAADTGAEFTLQHANRLAYINATWIVPVKDLVNIYKRLYKDKENASSTSGIATRVPTEEHLIYCMATAFAASRMDLRFGRYMFGYYGSRSPFLVEEMVDYYKGGLQDLAVSVAECYQHMVDLFESSRVPGPLCGTYFDQADGVTHQHKPRISNHETVKSMNTHVDLPEGMEQRYDYERGLLTLSLPEHAVEEPIEDDSPPIIFAFTEEQHRVATENLQRPFVYQQQPSMLSSNFPPRLDPDWREPRTCVDLGKRDNDSPDSSIITFSLPVSSAAIGHAAAAGDFDGDGEIDLAISAPYLSNEHRLASGQVFVLNGTRVLLAERSRGMVDDIRNAASQILISKSDKGRFGWSMATVDMNGDGVDDLAVAAPFGEFNKGYVDVYYGHLGQGLNPTADERIAFPDTEGLGLAIKGVDLDGDGIKDLVIGCPYCTVAGKAGSVFALLSSQSFRKLILKAPIPQPYEHFGSAVDVIHYSSASSSTLLLVGAPGYSEETKQRIGRVYAFSTDAPPMRLQWTMSASDQFQQFGSEISVSRSGQYVAVASPSEETFAGVQRYWQAGVVRVYGVHALALQGNVQRNLGINDGLAYQMEGRQQAGHLERGRVHKWRFRDNTMLCLKNEDDISRFGSYIQPFGDNILSITSEHYSKDARLSGAIHLIQQE